MSIITPLAARGISEADFCAWLGKAAPGDVLEYHHGFLAVDTALISGSSDTKTLRRLARRTHWASRQGLVHLVQQRRGAGRFAYLAVKRKRPRASRIAAAALVDCLMEAA